MEQRALGNEGIGRVFVGAVGLGFMPMTHPARVVDDRVDGTLRAALDAGVTFVDTADAYCVTGDMGENERVLAAALDRLGVRAQVTVATKGGHTRTSDGSWEQDGSPAHLREAVDASLRNLDVDTIDLYQFHRPDADVDYVDSLGALKEIHEAGKASMLGISNADVDQIRQAREILGDALVSVQNQFAPNFRSSQPELELCHELGLAFLPWSPLGGIGQAADLVGGYDAFVEVADELGISPQRTCLAWMLALSPVIIPIPGASRPETITDSAGAADVTLSPDQLQRLSATKA